MCNVIARGDVISLAAVEDLKSSVNYVKLSLNLVSGITDIIVCKLFRNGCPPNDVIGPRLLSRSAETPPRYQVSVPDLALIPSKVGHIALQLYRLHLRAVKPAK